MTQEQFDQHDCGLSQEDGCTCQAYTLDTHDQNGEHVQLTNRRVVEDNYEID